MANVDPFVIQGPRKWLQDPEIGPAVVYLNRFLHDMFLRSGGGNDAIADEGIKELYPWVPSPEDDFNEFKSLFPQVMQNGKSFEVIAVTADHTTSGNEILICNNASIITVTLNATPDDEEEVIIKRRGATVKVAAVKEIDGETNKTIAIRYDSPHLIFTAEANEYSII